MKKGIKIFIAAIVAFAVAAGIYIAYSKISADINGTEKGTAKEYTLMIEPNDFQYEIAEKLMNNDIVLEDSLWSNWIKKALS